MPLMAQSARLALFREGLGTACQEGQARFRTTSSAVAVQLVKFHF